MALVEADQADALMRFMTPTTVRDFWAEATEQEARLRRRLARRRPGRRVVLLVSALGCEALGLLVVLTH